MKKLKAHQMFATILLFAGFVMSPAVAQQPGAAAKSAQSPAASPASQATAPSASAPASPAKVVLKVGPDQVTQGDIDFLISNLNPQAQQALATQGRRPLGDEYVKVLLLSRQAENDHLESLPSVHQRLALQKTQMLAQAEYEKMAGEVKISPDELGQYFTAHQPEFETAQVREFVVRKKPDGAKEGTPGVTAEEARAKADAIRKALAAGTDPKKVAQDFSLPNVVLIDPEPRTIRHGQLLAALDKAAFELKDGEISEPMDTPQALVFLQIAGHHHPELKDVSREIENTIKQQKLDAEMDGLKKKSDIWMDEDYFKVQQVATPAPGSAPPAVPSAPKP